jgi:arylsulfatase A-like enzyme
MTRLLAWTLLLFTTSIGLAAEKPNIVVFLADDVSWKDFGCYGHPSIRTPHIDQLSKQGLQFENAFLTTSSCSPTRISVLSGLYPHATGAEDLHMPVPAGVKFVPTYLKEAGYFNGHMLKKHYGPEGDKQFDWYGNSFDKYPEFLDKAGDQPFFLWVGFKEAHRPYSKNGFDPPHDPATVVVPPYLADTAETRADLADYYDEIARMDAMIGDFMNTLKERGELENTLVVFFADNGMPFPRAKGSVYDSGIATPLVVSWPAVIKPGQHYEPLASVVDLAPTFLDVAGVDVPNSMQGRSLLPTLRDPSQPGREYVFSERNWHNCDEHIRTVRTLRYKLIHNAYLDKPLGNPSDVSSSPSWDSLRALQAEGRLTPEQQRLFEAPRSEWELYDLQADPHEFANLAEDPKLAEVRERLTRALAQWRSETGDFPAEVRTRGDNTNRITGEKFQQAIPKMENLQPQS